MTKLDLQKELLEKVKPGMKPSDLKKQPIPQPKVSDEGYESDKSDKSIKNFTDNRYTSSHSEVYNNKADQKLLDQITSLKKQLQLYQDFKEADLKIKEKYKQEIKDLD